LSKERPCEYCGGVIFFQEDPIKPRRGDGSLAWTAYNAETMTAHDCAQAPWNKKRVSVAEMWKRLKLLPVYCMECMTYYLQGKLCSHLERTGFRPGQDFPGRWMEKWMSEVRKSKSKKKNSNTMYNRPENQMQIDF